VVGASSISRCGRAPSRTPRSSPCRSRNLHARP
jgi:hypothetical protein